jgi:Flp pilus assembly protein TadB
MTHADAELGKKIDGSIAALGEKMTHADAELGKTIVQVNADLGIKMAELATEMQRIRAEVVRWVLLAVLGSVALSMAARSLLMQFG